LLTEKLLAYKTLSFLFYGALESFVQQGELKSYC